MQNEKTHRVGRGRWVERAIEVWLAKRGLVTLDSNFVIPGGEIDIIARDDGDDPATIVFVEVRSRERASPGSPEETISRRKQQLLVRAATRWLVERDLWERVVTRFDVIAVDTRRDPTADGGVEILDIRWYREAFAVD